MKRVESLDVLRGFAASFVVIFHTLLVPPLALGHTLLERIVGYGGLSVPLFFALSALSMMLGYHDRLDGEGKVLSFYVRRFFRIAPLFYAALFLHVSWRVLSGIPIDMSEVTLTISFLFPLLPGYQESLVMAGWSLGVEWMFYAIFPMFLAVFTNFSRSVAGLIAATIVAVLAMKAMHTGRELGPYNFDMSLIKNSTFFLIGAVIFYARMGIFSLSHRLSAMKVREGLQSTFLLVAGLVTIALAPAEKHIFYIYTIISWIFILTGGTIGFPVLLCNRFTIYIGKLSYSIYLMHPLAIVGCLKLGIYAKIYSSFSSSVAAFTISAFITYIATLAASTITYRLIEVPGQKLGRFLSTTKQVLAVAPSPN